MHRVNRTDHGGRGGGGRVGHRGLVVVAIVRACDSSDRTPAEALAAVLTTTPAA